MWTNWIVMKKSNSFAINPRLSVASTCNYDAYMGSIAATSFEAASVQVILSAESTGNWLLFTVAIQY